MVMFCFRGDAHKFFLKLKNSIRSNNKIDNIKEVNEIDDIISFYENLSNSSLKKIKYKMVKEQQASGSIPLLITTVPWLLFIFSKPLLGILFGNKPFWVPFVIVYVVLLFWGIFIHFHEKAWAGLHVNIIEDILSERK
jgi:hypothetical protein